MSVTVLAVHNDIAFLFALALQLEPNHVGLIPSASVKNAERLLCELKLQPDLLIINCKIRGVCAFASESLNRWPELKVVAVVSEGRRCFRCRSLLVATIGDSPSPVIDQWASLVQTLTHKRRVATQ
jgi:hypothetical protein